MKLGTLEPEFVEFVPANLTEGKLYVSMLYATTVHLCASGCGNKVVLPLSPAEWQLYFDGESVSLTPSVGNWEFPCRSHYWIKANKIRWSSVWTDTQIAAGRRRDAEALDEYVARREAARKATDRRIQTVTPWRDRIRSMLRWVRTLRLLLVSDSCSSLPGGRTGSTCALPRGLGIGKSDLFAVTRNGQ
jgi:hypothetical protein